MTLSAPNSAHNITVDDALAFVSKLARLGLYVGPIHVNETSAGASEANYIPLSGLADVPSDPICCLVWGGTDWHNVAQLRMTLNAVGKGGEIEGFKRVARQLKPTSVPEAELMNIPGAAAAVAKLISKA